MVVFPPMLREFMGSKKRDYCDCELLRFAFLTQSAQQALGDRKGMLRDFRASFYESLNSSNWILGFEFGDFPRMGRARAGITIDAVLDFRCDDCSHRHRLFVEMCTDNRQAILANLMKLEFASRSFLQSYPDGLVCSIGVFISEERKAELKRKGYVDGAIGSLEEYEIQATGPWEGLITSPLLALKI